MSTELQGYVPGEEIPRTTEMVAGSEDRLGIPRVSVVGGGGGGAPLDLTDLLAYTGPTTAPKVDTDAPGSLSSKLRGMVSRMVQLLARLPAALGAGGGLKVDGSGTALPVSGPLTDMQLRATPVPISGTVAVTGPLTNAQLRAADVKVTLDGEAVVLGAGTAAIGKLVANSGVDIGDVTINNAAGASAVNIQDGGNSITVDGSLSVSPSPGVDIGDVTVNNGSGAAAVNIQDGGNAITVDGSVTAVAQPGVDIGDVTVNNGSGAAAVNIQDGGNAITVDGSVTAVAQPGVDIGDVTVNNGSGAAAVNIQDGGNAITVDGTVTAAAQPGVDIGDVTINNAGAGSAVNIQDGGNAITVDGAVTVSGPVNLVPATSGGLTSYRNIDVDETGVLVKAGVAQVYGWFIYNAAAAARFVRIYNHVDAPAAGDAADCIATICLPAGSAANAFTDVGIACSAGIGLRATTAVADADVGAPGANDVVVNLWYK